VAIATNLVGLRSSLKCQIHAVLAAADAQVPMSDLFVRVGSSYLPQPGWRSSPLRIDSLLQMITARRRRYLDAPRNRRRRTKKDQLLR
jgi:hypothetical protein